MTKDEWVAVCGAALQAKGIKNFHPLEIADVGREAIAIASTHDRPRWKSILKAPAEDKIPTALILCELLCELRETAPFGPVLINSWYRSKLYNYTIGGVTNSMHTTGGAADITKIGWTHREVADWFKSHKDSAEFGIGRYNSFTHIDIRGKLDRIAPARWGTNAN